nr:DUF1285 domain-containing protein [Psychrobacter alimentarius]
MMNDNANNAMGNNENITDAMNNKTSHLNSIDALSQYIKDTAGVREGRAIPPLENWHPKSVADMDLVIKSNGEWWHEGEKVTRESLVSLFASILWKEDNKGSTEYFLKTPVQKLRIQVEDAPLFINDVGIVKEDGESWLEFTTTTGDVVRLDDEHPIALQAYHPTLNHSADVSAENKQEQVSGESVRPYMTVRNGLRALIARHTFYHLTEIGKLTESNGETILTLQSGPESYQISMPAD